MSPLDFQDDMTDVMVWHKGSESRAKDYFAACLPRSYLFYLYNHLALFVRCVTIALSVQPQGNRRRESLDRGCLVPPSQRLLSGKVQHHAPTLFHAR